MKASNAYSLPLRLAVGELVLLCIILTSGTKADSTCKRGCPVSDDRYLSYTTGNVYEYNFDSNMNVGLTKDSGSSDGTSLKVTGTAKIFAEGNCGYTLQLGAVKVLATKENLEKKIMQSIQKPIYFTMIGGKVEPELCSDQADNSYALNIKRAIISMMQSNTDSVQELDIFGQCPTHTTVTKIGGAEIVNKVRNLNACRYRKIINSGILKNAVQTNPGLDSSTSLLQADYSKESKIENGVVSTVQLVEEYKYAATAKSHVAVCAKVVTNLKLKNLSGSPESAPTTGLRSVSIMFQQPEVYTSKNIVALKASLTELVQHLDGYVEKDSAKNFVEIIRLMRNSDTETLLELAAFPLPNKVLARSVYFDALFRTGTSASVRAIFKQFSNMSEKEKSIAMTSLHLVQNVDKETLTQAASHLNKNAIKEVFLGVGSLVSKYCKKQGCSNGEVDTISKKFIESLKHCKVNIKKDEERILYILKGIGNTHNLASGVVPTLLEYISQDHSNRIRVAVLQAFSAAGCNNNLQKKALEILADRNEDSELRIEAYLAAIECPSGELANQIAEIVNSETVNQVGGFITSSLKTIRDSTNEDKIMQRRYFENIRIKQKFPKDLRRYSYNDEISYKMNALGLSASADYSLIYSQAGFLPRSAHLNIKAEEFGINMDILEASVRQENFENVLEYFLGPKGVVNKDLSEILGKLDNDNVSRRSRSISTDISKVAKKYKKNVSDLNLDLSLKLFGSEIMFLSLGDNIPNTFDEIAKEFTEAFENIKTELKDYNKEFRSHNFFMDTEIVYPTGLGIPLELTADGFMANKIIFGVNVDVESLMQSSWDNLLYKFKFVPSIDLSVNLKVGFNALVFSSGLRSVLTMHSATGSSIDLAFTHEGAGFDINFELPRQKIELVETKVRTDIFIAEQDKPTKSIALKVLESKIDSPTASCYNQFESLGFTPCVVRNFGDMKGVYLSEPIEFAVYIITEHNYRFRGYHHVEQAGVHQWKLDYSTPGSKESHSTLLVVELGTNSRAYGRASLEHARYHFAVETGVNNDDKELVLYAQYENGKELTKSKIGFTKTGNEYRPLIEIRNTSGGVSNEINGYRVDGRVFVQKSDEKNRLNFENLQLSNKDNNRATLNGWADLGPSLLLTDLHLTSNEDTFLIKSNFRITAGEYSAGLFINDENKPEYIYGASANVLLGENLVNTEVLSKFGKWEVTSTNKVQYLKDDGLNTLISTKFISSININHNKQSVGFLKVQGVTEGQNKFEINVDATSNKNTCAVGIKYVGNKKTFIDYQLSVNAKLNQHFVNLVSKCDIVGNHFVLDNILTTSSGSAFILKGELGQRYTAHDIYVDLQGVAQLSTKEKPAHWTLKVVGTPDKTNTEFKFSRDDTEIIKVLADTHHPHDKVTSAKVNLIVRNILTANADIKIAKNGKGVLTAIIDTTKRDSKHRLELTSKFHVQHPKYDIEANVVMDGQKKLYVLTENNIEKLKMSTKNIINVLDNKFLCDANGVVNGDWRLNGELQTMFSVTFPKGRILSGSLIRKIDTNNKNNIAQGHMDIKLEDQLANGGDKRSLILSGKLEKLNTVSKEFTVTYQMAYTNYEKQALMVDLNIKRLPNGQYYMIKLDSHVKGQLIQSPFDIAIVVDEYSVNHAVFNIDGKYGDVCYTKINGNYYVGKEGAILKYQLHSIIDLPHTSFKVFELNTNSQFSKSEIEGENYIFELMIDEKAGNEQFVKFNTNIKNSEKMGTFSSSLQTHKMETPLQIDCSYQLDHQASIRKESASGSVKYDLNFRYTDQFLKSSNYISYNGKESIVYRISILSSLSEVKELMVEIKGTSISSDAYNLNVSGKHNENHYNLDSYLYNGIHKTGLNVTAVLPKSEPIDILAIFEIIGHRKSQLNMELKNVFDLDFKFNGESSYKAIDDFSIVSRWDSLKLKLHNYYFDIRTQGKSTSVLLKSADVEIFSGSATCVLKQEGNKRVLEGQGQLKFQGTTQNTNFRLSNQVYEITTDNEFGFSYNFNGNFGLKNCVSTLKITNKDFNIKLSVCEEKKQCTNVQILSSNDLTPDNSFIHSFLVLLDLREIGFPYEFKLQSKNVRQGFKFQYMLDSSISSNNNIKYNLLASIQPNNIKLQLILPSRELALEAHQKYPDNSHIFGHYENSLAFFIDKANKPHDVTRFIAQADLKGQERVKINAKGFLKLEHPTIRPLTVSGKLDANSEHHILNAEVVFDVFKLPEQQIVATSQMQNIKLTNGFNISSSHILTSPGLGIQYAFISHAGLNTEQYEFKTSAELNIGNSDFKTSGVISSNKEHSEIIIYSLNKEVVKFVADYNKQNNQAKLNAQMQAFSRRPIEINAVIQPKMAKLNLICDGLLNSEGEVKLGKEFKFEIKGPSVELISGSVGLNAGNLLNSSYNVNEENIKQFLNVVENEIKQTSDATNIFKTNLEKLTLIGNRQVKLIKDSIPDFSQMKNSYQNNIYEISQELEVDPAMKHISDTLQKLNTKFTKVADKCTQLFKETYDKLHKSFIVLHEKLQVIVTESLVPAWEEISTHIEKTLSEIRLEISNVFLNTLKSILEAFKHYELNLKYYGKTISEGLKPINEAVQELFNVLASAIEDLLSEWIEYCSQLPTFSSIHAVFMEKLQSLQLGEKSLDIINNIFDQLHVLPVTTETSEFLTKVHEYIVAKLKYQQVDDENMVEELVKLFFKSIRSLWDSLHISTPASITNFSFSDLLATGPVSVDLFTPLSALLTFRLSVFNFIINEDWDNWLTKNDFTSWIFFNDFGLKGHVVDGRHIFTFDGQHMRFLGNCKYILAQDFVDNNFTVIAHINNGKMKSIFLTDREGQLMEINDASALKLNNIAVEYPQHNNGMHAWRLYYTVYMSSEYGVKIMCTTGLKICHIDVNGFYTSKTRGLLGNGNAEPFDDFIQIDGKVSADAALFFNGYGLGKCNPASVDPHISEDNNSHTEICNELFGYKSSLSVGYIFLNSKPYRHACDQSVLSATENDKEGAACSIATAYASAVKLENVFVFLPKRCLTCSSQAGKLEVGEEFTLKLPSNKADLVFVVDVDIKPIVMHNLVAPAITEVRETLKSRGFTDIQIGVIVYSANQRQPSILTSDNGKLNYNENLADVKITESKQDFDSVISQMITEKKVLHIFDIVKNIFKKIVPQPDELAFHLALNYPFRAEAAKGIVAVRSGNLEYDNMLKFVRAHVIGGETQFDAASLHIIAPVKDLSLEGIPTEKLIGFNSRLVATLDGKDAKKRSKLRFHNDMGIDFVLNNGGWVYTTHNFEQLKQYEQKKAVNQVTTSVADTLFKNEIVTECRCVPVHGIHAQHKCVIKSSNFIPNKKVKA